MTTNLGAGPFTNVTAANYAELAVQFARMNGDSSGAQFYVISEDAAPANWWAWLAYLDRLGVKTASMRGHGRATVPALWPRDFDIDAPCDDGPRPGERKMRDESIDRRRQSAAMLRALVAEKELSELERKPGFEQPRDPGEAEASRRYHEARLEELRQEYAAKAPTGSRVWKPPVESSEDNQAVDF